MIGFLGSPQIYNLADCFFNQLILKSVNEMGINEKKTV